MRWTARETITIRGKCVLPGLVEAHIHVESTLLMPPKLSQLLTPHGTTTVVADPLDRLHAATRELGCELAYPFGNLSFRALPVIPELRVTDQGLFDVNAQEFVHL